MSGNLIKAKDLAKQFPIWTEKTYLKKAKDGEIPCLVIGTRIFFELHKVKEYLDSITVRKGGSNGK